MKQHLDALYIFDLVIQEKFLSLNKNDPNYAGNYMYMGSETTGNKSIHYFKHVLTRNYINYNQTIIGGVI